jgi:F-type H+-transporting ATPase subunit gamma
MQSLEEVRRSIKSAQDLHSVVKTMKALAAVNIRQYEKAVESLVEFNRTTQLGLHVVLTGGSFPQAHEQLGAQGRVGAIVYGSDQGMAGQFNEQISSFAIQTLSSLAAPGELEGVQAAGLRVVPYLEDAGLPLEEPMALPGAVSGITYLVQSLLLVIDRWRREAGVDRVYLFSNRPVSTASYRPNMTRLLPFEMERLHGLEAKSWPGPTLPKYTMDRETLLAALVRQQIFVVLSRASAESQASENGARLAAMQAAEKNIEERLGELNSLYHDQRQNSITSELLDIVSGFEVLGGDR